MIPLNDGELKAIWEECLGFDEMIQRAYAKGYETALRDRAKNIHGEEWYETQKNRSEING